MRVTLTAIALLGLAVPATAGTPDGDVWIAKARSIILDHHLVARSVLRCATLIYDGVSTANMASITAVEKHGGRCGGDPNFASRMFTMNIDKASGQAAWDRDTGEMKPIR